MSKMRLRGSRKRQRLLPLVCACCGRGDESVRLSGEALVYFDDDGVETGICTSCDPSVWDIVAAMRADCPICSGRSSGSH